MHPFTFSRAHTLEEAAIATMQPATGLIAGGTELLNWLKEDIITPVHLVSLDQLPNLDRIEIDAAGLHLGALVRMSEVAGHDGVRRNFPAIADALLRSASPQIRNMGTMGGNLLQRTRCPYFRAEVALPCNKRHPGSGCAALGGEDRTLAIFGGSDHCIATHPSDAAVALAALDAVVLLQSAEGVRSIPLVDFHLLPGTTPALETVLRPGELITGIHVPASPVAARSVYIKLRERASYEFALVSAAVALDVERGCIREVHIALGGVAPKPWRLTTAEQALRGVAVTDLSALRTAVERGFANAKPGRQNGFKIELATRLAVRGLEQAGGIT